MLVNKYLIKRMVALVINLEKTQGRYQFKILNITQTEVINIVFWVFSVL